MKIREHSFGRLLSAVEQRQIKGGYPLCNVGQFAYCACKGGNICVVVPGQYESSGAVCQSYCAEPPVASYPGCYTNGCP